MSDRVPREVQITFDCADPGALCEFWVEVLGYQLQPPPPGFETWDAFLDSVGVPVEQRNDRSAAVPVDGHGPRLFFQRVPEGKSAKNRVHLDVRAAPGLENDERMAALEAEARAAGRPGRHPAGALRARHRDERRVHRDAGPRGQRVLPRLRPGREPAGDSTA